MDTPSQTKRKTRRITNNKRRAKQLEAIRTVTRSIKRNISFPKRMYYAKTRHTPSHKLYNRLDIYKLNTIIQHPTIYMLPLSNNQKSFYDKHHISHQNVPIQDILNPSILLQPDISNYFKDKLEHDINNANLNVIFNKIEITANTRNDIFIDVHFNNFTIYVSLHIIPNPNGKTGAFHIKKIQKTNSKTIVESCERMIGNILHLDDNNFTIQFSKDTLALNNYNKFTGDMIILKNIIIDALNDTMLKFHIMHKDTSHVSRFNTFRPNIIIE